MINFSTFEIGRRALRANQTGIDVTGQNIANVNTPGYSRQQVLLSESAPLSFNGHTFGSGVTIQGVQAFRDRFIETRIQTETGIAGRLNAETTELSQVEAVLQGSPNGSLQNALNDFFGAFSNLNSSPNSLPLRVVAAQKGDHLTSVFHQTRSRLTEIRTGTDAQIRSTVGEVNTLAEKIAQLNGQIKQTEIAGGSASALIDQRTEFVKNISELTGAHAIQNDDGTVSLTIGEGRSLVLKDTASPIQISNTPPLGLASLSIDGQPATFNEGKIRGLQNALAVTEEQINSLDGLAEQVVLRVNNLHTSGTDLNGNAGGLFFEQPPKVTAENIAINSAITTNPRLIVASPVGQSGTVAGEISKLLNDPNTVVGTRTGSFTSIYSAMTLDVSERVKSAENDLQTQAAIIAQASVQRDSVSGVSLDEEAINLLQYQKAYEAAARFLKVADEMTQTILSLAG